MTAHQVSAIGCKSTSDVDLGGSGYFVNHENDDCSLILYVGGMGGPDTWDVFVNSIELENYDYAVLHSPKYLTLGENLELLEGLLRKLDGYSKVVMVGYSMGGVLIKDLVLRNLFDAANQDLMPDLVVTYATPLTSSRFKLQLSKRLLYFFGVTSQLKPLEVDVLKGSELDRISWEWRDEEKAGRFGFRRAAIFATNDNVIDSSMERRSRDTAKVNSGHINILDNPCSRAILLELLANSDADLRDIGCVETEM